MIQVLIQNETSTTCSLLEQLSTDTLKLQGNFSDAISKGASKIEVSNSFGEFVDVIYGKGDLKKN